jgi:hypothetical protein
MTHRIDNTVVPVSGMDMVGAGHRTAQFRMQSMIPDADHVARPSWAAVPPANGTADHETGRRLLGKQDI